MNNCKVVSIPFGYEAEYVSKNAQIEAKTGNTDHHCKTARMSHINKMLDSIQERVDKFV